VSNTAYVAEGALTFEMIDTYVDGNCYQYGAGESKVTVNGEPVAISSSGYFQDVVRESFDVVGCTPSITGWMSRMTTTRMR
jgi:hypothetical protein